MGHNLLSARGVSIHAPGGRRLIRNLVLGLDSGDRVALVGRNGVGKSSLLHVLAGDTSPERGIVRNRGTRVLVPQDLRADTLTPCSSSPGERRRSALETALRARPDLLLLDEPSRDLDSEGLHWLVDWLAAWRGALLVVSHDKSLLETFHDFFIVAESGCRHVVGDFGEVLTKLERESDERERRYVANLNRLIEAERRHDVVRRRRQRKKNVGRLHELARCPSRATLNSKRSYAQESQGKRATTQSARVNAAREWTKATRRALTVELPLEAMLPELPASGGTPAIVLNAVSAEVNGRLLFESLSVSVTRDRLALVGPNGSGKSTLLEVALGVRSPADGQALQEPSRIGYVSQDAENWVFEESLLDVLLRGSEASTLEGAARTLRAHRFPFALGLRSMRSLSPGERLRAALICICERRPAPDVWVLDEPTAHLDFVGKEALKSLVARWPGGLLVASHDVDFLSAIDVAQRIELGRQRPFGGRGLGF